MGLVTHEHGVRALRDKMPILSKEKDLYPDNLFEVVNADGGDRSWRAVYTRSRREKDLMRRLMAMDIPYYGPCAAKRTRSPKGRVRVSWMPLFSNYVFMFGNEDDRQRALTTNCISRVLDVADKEKLTADLRRLSLLINTEAPVQIEQQITPGTMVRVKSGPFAGCEGVVEKRRGKDRLVVAVEFVQQGVSVELEDFSVEVL